VEQEFLVIERTRRNVAHRLILDVRFVPMTGEALLR
jgi:hypothetical protein